MNGGVIVLKYQNIVRTFLDGYHIKLYEMRGDQKAWPPTAHAHEYFQLWYVCDGKCIHEIGGQTCEVLAGELVFVPPDVEHSISTENGDCIIYGCDFAPDILLTDSIVLGESIPSSDRDFYDELLRVRCKYILPKYIQTRVESILKKMLNIYMRKQPYSIFELKGYLLRLLASILQYTESSGDAVQDADNYSSNINEAIAYTNEHIADRIYIKDAAACAKMSIGSFHYYFKKHTGKTYVDYVNMLRIEVAKTLLVESGLTVSAIGQEVGFSDSAYFNRQFKKYVGCTPGEYRYNNTDA